MLPEPCAKRVCVSHKFNEKTVPAGSIIWLSAAFSATFSDRSESPAGVSLTNSHITIGGVTSSAPDSYVKLSSSAPAEGSVSFVEGQWQSSVPLDDQDSFLGAVAVKVPPGAKCSGASVTWCGDLTAPGEVDVAIAAAVYSSCPYGSARPQGVDSRHNNAGTPVGCAANLKPGGTGEGKSNGSGDFSEKHPACKSGGCSKPRENSGHNGYAGNGQARNW